MTDAPRRASNPDPDSADAPRAKRGRSPHRRLVLLALLVLTLPFPWGERSSCEGSPKTFTGIELVTERPSDTVSVVILFVAPVLLGFAQHHTRNALARLLMELGAMLFASLGTLYCFVNAVFSGGFLHASGRVYPAPWIATVAPLVMLVDAGKGAIQRIGELLARRKQRQRAASRPDLTPPAPEP